MSKTVAGVYIYIYINNLNNGIYKIKAMQKYGLRKECKKIDEF